MKTKVEINGYEIEIELVGGVINVVATKDDETIEEFSIETEEGSQGESEDIQGFDDFDEEEDFEGGDEDEFEGQGEDEEDEDEDQDEDEFEGQDKEDMKALESFQSFINKKRK
jgi:hypothetical protein